MNDALCTLALTNMMVLRNGIVRVCCYNPIPMGNLNNQSVEEIWHGINYKMLREKLKENDFSFGCKDSNCPIIKRLKDESDNLVYDS